MDDGGRPVETPRYAAGTPFQHRPIAPRHAAGETIHRCIESYFKLSVNAAVFASQKSHPCPSLAGAQADAA